MEQNEWEKLSLEEKKRQLFLKQKRVLQDFLERHAISQAQFDKSFSDMMQKIGYDSDGNKTV